MRYVVNRGGRSGVRLDRNKEFIFIDLNVVNLNNKNPLILDIFITLLTVL
jgi:hypothetical protein